MNESIGGFQIRNQWAAHFLTFTIVDWVDVFTRSCYCEILIDNFRFYQQHRGLEVYGYVIMTNHIHTILRQPKSEWSLSDTIRDFKKMSANQIIKQLGQPVESRRDWISERFRYNASQRMNCGMHQVWTQNNHPEEVFSQPFFNQKLRYIHNNPVKAGYVEKPEHWRYSSASDLVSAHPMIQLSDWR